MSKGFSLIGMLVAVLIIGILVAWWLPRYAGHVRQEQQTQQHVLGQVRQLDTKLNQLQQQKQHQLENL